LRPSGYFTTAFNLRSGTAVSTIFRVHREIGILH
jgi:hypothetical protein